MSDAELAGLEPLAGLRIEDDAPGTRLHLVWSGAPPYLMLRLAAFAVVAGLVGWSAWSIYELAADPQRFFNQDLDEGVFRILGIVLRLGIAWFAAQITAWTSGYWRELDFNAGENTFVARRTGFLLLDNQRTLLTLDKITYAALTAHQTGGPPELALNLMQLGGGSFEGRFPTVGLDPRGPEQDLMFRIGRMLGSEGVYVEEHSPVRTRLRLDMSKRLTQLGANEDDFDDEDDDFDEDDDLDENGDELGEGESQTARKKADGEDDEDDDDSDDGWTPPPELQLHPLSALSSFSVTALAEQAGLAASSLAEDDEEDAAPLDVAAFNAQFELWRIADWRPGQIIQFERKPEPRWLVNTLTVLAFLAAGGLGAWLVHDWVAWVPFNPLGRWGTGLYCGLAGAIVARVLAFHRMCARDLTIDWMRRELIMTMHGRPRAVPFKNARRLALWTTEATAGTRAEPGESREGATEYKAVLTLVAEGGDLLLYDGEKLHTSRERARGVLEPLARQMSRVLNLPCQQAQNFAVLDDGYPQWQALQPSSWAVLATVAVVTLAILGYGFSLQAQATSAKDAIRAAGAEVVTFMAHEGDRQVWPTDYQMVRFPPGTDNLDAKLAEIAPYLSQLGDCGFDFEQQGITDAGLAHLANLPQMRDLNLTNTQVTGAGLAIFETSNGVARLQLFNTAVGNDGLAHIAHLKQLRSLRLGRTRVTDAGLEHLAGLDKLERVHFGEFVDVSPQGLAKLRLQLPGLEILE